MSVQRLLMRYVFVDVLKERLSPEPRNRASDHVSVRQESDYAIGLTLD